ncbi:MAG: hypothetical protein BGO70_11705 [Bacteroidetes bacterium 43-93]|jgi:hypothetical protein|nr:hypothetical protein [Bacteroidota bacterium]OJW98129.1 MAG: hypothetical protein BGO70_11705 [Bacteroidetes bacterium 43-93]
MKKLVFVGLLAFATTQEVYAQGCAMCTKTANSLDEKSARGLNGGILYLALLPLGIMGTVGFIWWRGNKTRTAS